MIISILFQAFLHVPHRKTHFNGVFYNLIIYLDVIIMKSATGILTFALSRGFSGIDVCDKIVHLNVTLFYFFFFDR